jgi:hypothetical protein
MNTDHQRRILDAVDAVDAGFEAQLATSAIRQSMSRHTGTLEAQSPPLMMPGLKLIGCLIA